MSLKTEFSWIPVTLLPNGGDLRLPLHVIEGARPGPTLGLSALIHGDEPLPSLAIIRRVLELLDPAELSGKVLVLPVCNPLGNGENSRHTPRDGANMNGVFSLPEANGYVTPVRTLSEQMADALVEGFLQHLDYHIDFHAGDASLSVNMIEFADDPAALAMARAFNTPVLLKDEWGSSQFWGASERLGSKLIVAECGGGGLLFEEWLERGVQGTFNVMRHLGMLPGQAQKPPRQLVVDNTGGHHHNLTILRPREGGLLIPDPAITPRVSFQGDPVEGVPILGQLLNMYDLEFHQTFEAPFERTILLAAAVAPSWYYPGDTAYIVADADGAEILD
jgi:uncharacterized protein